MAVILVIDDEPTVLRLVTRLLEREAHRVIPAASSAEALARLQDLAHGIDVAVVDASVRPDGAAAATRQLREAAGPFGLVWIGGESLDEAAAAALHHESGRFLPKPFSPKALSEAVAAQIRGDVP
jgi:two-component system alkaline phosphatase synthesis response regulator PhoP